MMKLDQQVGGTKARTRKRDIPADPGYNAAMAAIENAKAGAFTSELDKTIADLYGQMADRAPFRYRAEDDPLYAQYAALYEKEGRRAMEDTMGKAAALTGGYGSSYAQAAGQSAYNAYLEKLGALIPQLERNAYDRYQDAGEDLAEQYRLAVDQRDWQYGLAQDAFDRYLDTRDWNFKQEQAEYDREQDAKAWEWKQAQEEYQKYLDSRDWQHKLETEKVDTGLSQKQMAALQKAYPEKVVTAEAWKILSALYGENTLTGLGYGKEPPKTAENPNKVYTATNQSGDGWIYVAGLGRLSWAELDRKLKTGEVEQTTDEENRTTTYRLKKQRV